MNVLIPIALNVVIFMNSPEIIIAFFFHYKRSCIISFIC